MVEVKRIVGEFLGLLEGLGGEIELRVDTAQRHVVIVADGRRFDGADLGEVIFRATIELCKPDTAQQELWRRREDGQIPVGMCG